MCVSQSADITSVCLINIHFLFIYSNQKAVFVGGKNIMNIYSKPSCDIITICFPDKTIFIMLSGPEVFTLIFLQFFPKTRLAKYDHTFVLFSL